MTSVTSEGFISNAEWLENVVRNKDLILYNVSALEYLELFNGYMNERKIHVYAKHNGEFENIEYKVVDSFDNIEFFNANGVLCTTANQTINDMLSDYDNIDELAFIEGLSNFYYLNNESFETLNIKEENMKIFNQIKQQAIDYYCEN